jgi:hypothetical protein
VLGGVEARGTFAVEFLGVVDDDADGRVSTVGNDEAEALATAVGKWEARWGRADWDVVIRGW